MKRYSVFVSSTKSDTKSARDAVISALLSSQYLPCCMEFPHATQTDTRAHINSQIEISDYVCLLLKHEYGNVPETMATSWTEYEYLVARELHKPVLACVYNGKQGGKVADRRTTELAQRIERDGQILIFWSAIPQMSAAVLGSLKAMTEKNPRGGWVRRDHDQDEQESLESFYRRSADYDFSTFILHKGDIRIMMNDGYNWFRRHHSIIRARFETLPQFATTILTLDDGGDLIKYVAAKSEKSESEQEHNIIEFHSEMRNLAADCKYTRLSLLKSNQVNTHCLFLTPEYCLVTTYFTSKHRFRQLPLFKYRAGTELYDDFSEDFDLIARPLLNQLRLKLGK